MRLAMLLFLIPRIMHVRPFIFKGILLEVAADTFTALSNVFKIKANKEVHVYRTEVAADKKHLIAQLRHLGDEIMARRRKEREGEHQRRKSLWVGGDVRNGLSSTHIVYALTHYCTFVYSVHLKRSPQMFPRCPTSSPTLPPKQTLAEARRRRLNVTHDGWATSVTS